MATTKRYHELTDIHTAVQSGVRRSDFYADGGERAIDMLSPELNDGTAEWVASRIQCESALIRSGSPYFKIGGHYLDAASRTRLNVPCDALRLPFPAILVRLQEGHGTIMYGGELMTIVAAESSDNGLTIHALFRNDDAPEGNPLSFSVRIDGGGSLDDAIEQSARNCRHRDIDGNSLGRGAAAEMDRVARQCLKVLATVALLAVGRSELLEPDVLSRDRAKMQSADGEARSRIAARARRRGKTGWTVGETRLPRNAGAPRGSGIGRELTRSHLRCGHFHPVRHGRGRTEIKVMWFPPTAVRPDLPVAESRGYVTAT